MSTNSIRNIPDSNMCVQVIKKGRRRRKRGKKHTFMREQQQKSCCIFFLFMFLLVYQQEAASLALSAPCSGILPHFPRTVEIILTRWHKNGEKQEEGEDRGVECDDADWPEGVEEQLREAVIIFISKVHPANDRSLLTRVSFSFFFTAF